MMVYTDKSISSKKLQLIDG